jgi:hypothetical protein
VPTITIDRDERGGLFWSATISAASFGPVKATVWSKCAPSRLP